MFLLFLAAFIISNCSTILYVFFSASTKRWDVIKKHVSDLTLKPLSNTRWSSRIEAIKPLRYQIGEVYDALLEIVGDNSLETKNRQQANSLAAKIQNYKFVCSVTIWYNILFKINCVSKMMQNPTINIKICIEHLNNLIDYFTDIRSDKGFNDFLTDANELADEIDVETNFPDIKSMRPRRKKRQFDYERTDQPILNSKIKFKVAFF